MPQDPRHEAFCRANRLNWDERRPSHVASPQYDRKAFWSRRNGCRSTLPARPAPNVGDREGSRASLDAFEACAPGGEVNVYVIDRGGHTWPGPPVPLAMARR